MDDPILKLIEEFQNYIGKRIQRFHPKIPGICSYYGLGWMRLERVIQTRKLMFMHTILVMEDENLSKKIFCDRARMKTLALITCLGVWCSTYSMLALYLV